MKIRWQNRALMNFKVKERRNRGKSSRRSPIFVNILVTLSVCSVVSLSAGSQSAVSSRTLFNADDESNLGAAGMELFDLFATEFSAGEIPLTLNRATMEAAWDNVVSVSGGGIPADFDIDENGFEDRDEMGCFGELHEAGLLSPGVAEAFAANRAIVDSIDGAVEQIAPGFDLVMGYYTTLIGDGEGVITQTLVLFIDAFSSVVGAGGVDGDPNTDNPSATGQTYLADNGFDSSLADTIAMGLLQCSSPCDALFGPVITLLGFSSVTLECGTAYADAGATASDACDGDLTPAIAATTSLNTDIPGVYAVFYNVVDSARNEATEVTRMVTVVDTLPPVITLAGSPSVFVECGDAYVDAGASAFDSCDGDLTAGISATGMTNTNVPGVYTVRYTVVDSSGNAAIEVTRIVTVADTLPPVITLTGSPSVFVECADAYVDAGASAFDNCDGDLTSAISTSDMTNTSTPGVYTVRYNAIDSAGNTAIEVTRTVTVTDTVAPLLTVLGDSPATVVRGGVYTDAGAEVSDGCTLDLGSINAMGTVDTTTRGSYILTYRVEDSFGNITQATRIVHVVDRFGCSSSGTPSGSPFTTLRTAAGDLIAMCVVFAALGIFGRRRRNSAPSLRNSVCRMNV